MARNKVYFLISLLLAFWFCSGQSLRSQDNGVKVRMLIHDFAHDTVESLSDKTIDIRPLLKESFVKYDEIVILNNSDFPEITVESLLQNGDSVALSGVDLIVYGSYVIVNEYVRIQSVIYTTADELFHRVNYSRGTRQGLEVLVDEVRDNIFEELVGISPELQQSVKNIAFISDFETVSGKYDNIGMMKNKSKALTKEVMRNVEYLGPANTEVIPWKKVEEYHDNPSDESLKKLDADMFVKLTYIYKGAEVVALKTDFDILEKDRGRILKREFILPELRRDYYTSYDFQEFITNEMLAFLERIITPTGQWDHISFPNKSSIKTTNKDVLLYRAQNFATKNDFYLSSYHYYEALIKFPDEVKAEDLKLQIGFNKVYTNRFDEANEEFDFVLTADPDNSYAYLGKSLINYYEGNSDVALEYLETAREKGVENTFLVEVLKGYYFYELGNYEDALEAFQKSLATQQQTISIRIINNLSVEYIKIHLGLCYVGLARYDEAISYYKEIRKEFPYNKEVNYYLGNAYSKKAIDGYFAEDYAQAISDFTESRKYFANRNVNDYLRTALIYEMQFEQARLFIDEEIEEGNYDTLFVWSEHAMDIRALMINNKETGNGDTYDQQIGSEAIDIFRLNLKYNPNDPLSHYHIGEIYTLLGDFEMGLQYMEKANQIDDINFDIQLGLMQSYLLTGKYSDCERLEKSLSKLYRRLSVPSRFTALMDYMYISASMAQDKKVKKKTKELNNLLNEQVVIDSWFYEPYLAWLENCGCTADTKKYLADLTIKMQNRNLN